MIVPARGVLDRAAEARLSAGNENHGYLSEEFGLLPVVPPRPELPDSHRTWDDTAALLPELFRSVTGREALEAMPTLPADENALADEFLLRAASLLGHFAHAYVRVRPDPPEELPACVSEPWAVVTKRLRRDQMALTYDDLVSGNWRLRDPAGDRSLDNLEMLTPTVANQAERIFYMAQVEVLAKSAPAIGAMVRAQEAVAGGDEGALADELAVIIDLLDVVTFDSFSKIDANPYSPTYVDPVVWAKTVAPFAVAICPGQHAISGAAAPIFQVFDVFIGRRAYLTRVGREAFLLRPGFSSNLREFLTAIGEISVAEFVFGSSSKLRGLWNGVIEAYSGESGFLGVHRRKAYAFLEIAFKVGRSVTTGGFSGLFEDQTWEVAHAELEASRQERLVDAVPVCPMAPVRRAGEFHGDGLAHVVFDVTGLGLRFKPGDRLAVQPRNSEELVDRTLAALHAKGDEPVRLDSGWRLYANAEVLPLREILERGTLRPIARPVAIALLEVSCSERLARIVNDRSEGAWELWDLLGLLADGGFDPTQLWLADPWEPHALPKIVPPERFRPYSIASAMDGDPEALTVEVLAAELRYRTEQSATTPAAEREGSGSAFLRRLGDTGAGRAAILVRPSSRCRLPTDARGPIVLFAGGAGVSMFRALLTARSRQPSPGPAVLFLSTRSGRHRDLYTTEFAGIATHAIVTSGRHSAAPGSGITELMAAHAQEISRHAADPATSMYICGPAGFARAVIDTLERLVSREQVRTMIAGGRLQSEVFTSVAEPEVVSTFINASEVAFRNNDSSGYWTIIDGGVYDVTEFAYRHPGGAGILWEVAGRDGTHAYQQIEHHLDAGVEALLPLYQVGTIGPLDFGQRGAAAVLDSGLRYLMLGDLFSEWVRYLHLVVEIENAVTLDFSMFDNVTVGDDDPGRPTFLKAQLLLEAHQRFIQTYLSVLLGGDLRRLWASTAAFVAPAEDVRTLPRAVTRAARRGPAVAAQARLSRGVSLLRSVGLSDPDTRTETLLELAAWRSPLRDADLRLLRDLKHRIARGVAAFERYQSRAPERAGPVLLAALRAVPEHVAVLHRSVVAGTGHPPPASTRPRAPGRGTRKMPDPPSREPEARR